MTSQSIKLTCILTFSLFIVNHSREGHRWYPRLEDNLPDSQLPVSILNFLYSLIPRGVRYNNRLIKMSPRSAFAARSFITHYCAHSIS